MLNPLNPFDLLKNQAQTEQTEQKNPLDTALYNAGKVVVAAAIVEGVRRAIQGPSEEERRRQEVEDQRRREEQQRKDAQQREKEMLTRIAEVQLDERLIGLRQIFEKLRYLPDEAHRIDGILAIMRHEEALLRKLTV